MSNLNELEPLILLINIRKNLKEKTKLLFVILVNLLNVCICSSSSNSMVTPFRNTGNSQRTRDTPSICPPVPDTGSKTAHVRLVRSAPYTSLGCQRTGWDDGQMCRRTLKIDWSLRSTMPRHAMMMSSACPTAPVTNVLNLQFTLPWKPSGTPLVPPSIHAACVFLQAPLPAASPPFGSMPQWI
jgi:hypothetical protein